ncbi:MAG: HDIG domain-containing protein [Deltaproteobacteria bacterium]|nr:HDIG domain-containing protein [Deltaproteobacteria bacterium]
MIPWSPRSDRRLGAPLMSLVRWLLPLVAAATIAGGDWLLDRVYAPRALEKGSVARYVVRASTDAVFDLHESYEKEAQAAKESYVPIYNKDNQLLYQARERIIAAALTRPLSSWRWPPAAAEGGAEEGQPSTDAGAERGAVAPVAGEGEGADEAEEESATRTQAERRRELEAMLRGFFDLLEPYFKAGVVADTEFPNEKDEIRIFWSGLYVTRPVSGLHRFSVLRPALERSGRQFFFKIAERPRKEMLDFILQRLPPNLTYARENEKFIVDISQVTGLKVVLIRRGEVLVRRGAVVDSRAFYGLRALAAASGGAVAERRAVLARVALLGALLLVFAVAAREVFPPPFEGYRAETLTYAGLLLLSSAGTVLLAYAPVHAAMVPQAALPLIIAAVVGRLPAMVVAITMAVGLAVTHVFDLTTMVVAASGGLAGALVVRRRRRSATLAAGVLVGLAQMAAFEATSAMTAGGSTYAEHWSAAQAFAGGLLSGVVALLALPFVQRWLGQSSRGALRALADYDRPLLRRLREKAPETFAHTLRVVNLADRAAEAIFADRALVRVGALYHDIGRLEPGGAVAAAEAAAGVARAELSHVVGGLRLATEHRLPPDVRAFITQHHGTLELAAERDVAEAEAASRGAVVDPALFRYPGPKPQSVEAAVVMIANRVERAASTPRAAGDGIVALVEREVLALFSAGQFEECGLTQKQLGAIKTAIVSFLESGGEDAR